MRKHWSAAISFALAVAMLAGCGASGTADTAADSTGASMGAESAAADTAESAEAAAGQERFIWHGPRTFRHWMFRQPVQTT